MCGLVPAETYTLTCTHIFCPACFAGVVQKTKSSLHCPVDNKSFRPKKALQPSSMAKDYVLGLIVFCFNKTNGCSFFGTVEAMLNHFGGCLYWDLICQLCRAPVLRSNLVSHVKTAHAKPKRNVAPRSTSPAM
uniref:Secreted protein, putative n=1 Tax=Ixodes scapularis TaxID=6945 RepID=A0A1S4M7E2_IXOSC